MKRAKRGPHVDRDVVITRIALHMKEECGKVGLIEKQSIFFWADLLAHICNSSDSFLIANREKFQPFLEKGEWQ